MGISFFKNCVALLVICILIWGIIRFFIRTTSIESKKNESQKIKIIPTKAVEQSTSPEVDASDFLLFIPYWQIPDNGNELMSSRVAYFGISPRADGSIVDDEGLQHVDRFIDNLSGISDRLLVVRMLDSEINETLLSSSSNSTAFITRVKNLAKEKGFSGVALDLEQGSSIILRDQSIHMNSFIHSFAAQSHEAGLHFAVLIYGDTYYRHRPYDLKYIAQSADEIMIMLYDFHKSRSEAGPLYPLFGKEKYGYDITELIPQLLHDAKNPSKITVVYGMYGYDWKVGKEGKPLTAARALRLNDIEQGILPFCKNTSQSEEVKNCVFHRDQISHEPVITYTDSEHISHVVWYEDEESMGVKMKYFATFGITSSARWVWGYY